MRACPYRTTTYRRKTACSSIRRTRTPSSIGTALALSVHGVYCSSAQCVRWLGNWWRPVFGCCFGFRKAPVLLALVSRVQLVCGQKVNRLPVVVHLGAWHANLIVSPGCKCANAPQRHSLASLLGWPVGVGQEGACLPRAHSACKALANQAGACLSRAHSACKPSRWHKPIWSHLLTWCGVCGVLRALCRPQADLKNSDDFASVAPVTEFAHEMTVRVRGYLEKEAKRRGVPLLEASKATPMRWLSIVVMAAIYISTLPSFFAGEYWTLLVTPFT